MNITLSGVLRWKSTMWVLMGLLLVHPVYPALFGGIAFAADPAKYLLEYYGLVATALFVAVCCLTPLRVLWPYWSVSQALNRHRRLIGVSCFYFVVLHLIAYFLHLGKVSFHEFTTQNLFLWSGAIAALLLALLAMTSLRFFVRKMGGKNWKRLHRSVYVIAFLIFFHQATQEKAGPQQSLYYFAPLVLFQAARVFVLMYRRKNTDKRMGA